MDEISSNSDFIDIQKYAVVVWALAVTRGILYEVSYGRVEIEEIQKVLDVTSMNELAKRFGYDDSELSIEPVCSLIENRFYWWNGVHD